MLDAVVIGSGPNGLAAAVVLAQSGAQVRVLEAHDELGGGTRTAALTRDGFLHDVCSGAHPMGVLSPFLRALPLQEHGLTWCTGRYSFAHPLDDEPAVVVSKDVDETAAELGRDGAAYRRMVAPYLKDPHGFLADALAPLHVPNKPFALARFGLNALRSARGLARARFSEERARALFAGCAAHSILPLDKPLSAALGLMFALTAHVVDWPVARGGSHAITRALASYLRALGGEIVTGHPVRALSDLPEARVFLFDTSPRTLVDVAGPVLPASYLSRLRRFRYGPGSFKIDYALAGPIPWRDPRTNEASTVHLGGTLDEIADAERAPWEGRVAERPYVLVVQQSELDDTRAPAGQHTGYAYCHVPAGSDEDCTAVIEAQLERFAPGFKDLVLARHTRTAAGFERYNESYVGGAITGGVTDLAQLFFRPVARVSPYKTPHPRVFLCSASTPPGGGVHGMCGYHAGRAALSALAKARDPLRLSA